MLAIVTLCTINSGTIAISLGIVPTYRTSTSATPIWVRRTIARGKRARGRGKRTIGRGKCASARGTSMGGHTMSARGKSGAPASAHYEPQTWLALFVALDTSRAGAARMAAQLVHD